jgi:ABC-type multidrug transport system ATPase subunit
LDKVCIHLDKNSVFGLLGPNGAGKSTLIKIMTGEEVATKGRVFIGGTDVTKSPELTSSMVGLCPQFDVLWDDLSVEEHLLFYARLKGVPRAYERARVVRPETLFACFPRAQPYPFCDPSRKS